MSRRRPLSYYSKRDLNPISPDRLRDAGALFPTGPFMVEDVVPDCIRHGCFPKVHYISVAATRVGKDVPYRASALPG